MIFSKSEQNLLSAIKYIPVIPLMLFSIIITIVIIDEKHNDLQREIENTKTKYINENKLIIQNEITQIVDLIELEIKQSEESLKEFIKDKVYEAHKVATNIYKEASHSDAEGNHLTKKQILNTIKFALTGMSYKDNRGYFFMDDIEGNKLLQPFNKDFEGKNFLNFTDPKGYKFIQKRVEVIKNKSEAFDQYYWYKPYDKKNLYKKISFYKYFEPFNISIGTGEYIVDFENELKNNVLKWINKINKGQKKSYIFIYTMDGTSLAHIKEDYLGKNMLHLQDEKGNLILQELIQFTRKNHEGFYNYNASYSGGFESSNKISFVKLLQKWNWMIGTGFYLDSLKEEILKKEKELIIENKLIVHKIIMISVFITLILIFITFYISNIIAQQFTNYKKNITHEMQKTLEKEKLLVQQSKMAMMGEMIDNIAHQWKQPLSVIRMSNQFIKLDKEAQGLYSKEEVLSAIDNIDDSVMHLSTTIDDFRNFFNPHKEKNLFTLEDTINKSLKLLQSDLKQCNINIIENIKDIELTGYQNELIQVLINIIKNAKDEFIRHENILIKYIFIDVFEQNNLVCIKIKDNCGGIPVDIIDNIFTSYFTTKDEYGGSGIGLYMSKQIIDNMNGILEANNEKYMYNNHEYEGAVFTITLPKS